MEIVSCKYETFTINDPAHFSSEIKKLSKHEQLQVLDIILKSDNSSYTENSNGSYVSLHTVKDKKVLYDIHCFMNFCKRNTERLKEDESKREEEIKQFLTTISNKSKVEKNNEEQEDELEDQTMGERVVLKKSKVKFSGNKGKLLKSFKNVSKINKSNIKTTVSTKPKKTLFITETALDDEDLEDIDEDNISNHADYDEDEDEEDVKDMDIDICEEEAEIEHEEISDSNLEGKVKSDEDDEDDEEDEDDDDEDDEEDDEDDEVDEYNQEI